MLFSLSPAAGWGMGEGGRVMSFPESGLQRLASRCRSNLRCTFTGIYAHIIQSAKVLPSYCPMRSDDTQPALCDGVWGQAICPSSVSTDKGQEAGSILDFGLKLGGLQLAGTSFQVI